MGSHFRSIMIGRAIVFPLLISLNFGCEDVGMRLEIRNGTYTGTFTIRQSDGSEHSGGVTFTFHDGSYTCSPEVRYLPPGGAGTYHTFGTTLVLTDTVAHTAEFDWTLILGGEFAFSFDGRTLKLTQDDTKYHRHRVIVLKYLGS